MSILRKAREWRGKDLFPQRRGSRLGESWTGGDAAISSDPPFDSLHQKALANFRIHLVQNRPGQPDFLSRIAENDVSCRNKVVEDVSELKVSQQRVYTLRYFLKLLLIVFFFLDGPPY